MIALCAQVTLTPEDTKTILLNKGNNHGFKTGKSLGGQTPPIQILGDKLKWKNAQKKEKKNIISEIINKTIPKRKPLVTFIVWCPSKVDSVIISKNQRYKKYKTITGNKKKIAIAKPIKTTLKTNRNKVCINQRSELLIRKCVWLKIHRL